MRDAFSAALIRAAKANPRIRLITGDHGYALFDEFRRECPDQYLNAGIAEQNMVGVAAGLAKAGFFPVVYGLSAFVPIRVLEQIKIDLCYEKLPALLIGDGAGVVYSALGTSHQSTEDIAALRAVPDLAILSPADAYEMTACMELAFRADRPVYMRMGKADLGNVHAALPDLDWGRMIELRSGQDMAFVATGSMVKTAMSASEHWPESSVWSAPTLKPIDKTQITQICCHHKLIVTLEEHSVMGGLGSIVAEVSSESCPSWVYRIGIQDRFSQYCGSYNYLMEEHKLDLKSVCESIEEFRKRM